MLRVRCWGAALLLLLAGLCPAQADFRAAWVASVHNLNFPSRPGLSEAAARAELAAICNTAKATGLDALFFQVRPECDALYPSRLDPWSYWVSGAQGQSPGYDPLRIMLQEASSRGIAVHAWLNPYRAASSNARARSSSHLSRLMPGQCVPYEGSLWMDPGSPAVRAHVVKVCADLLSRYELAGIHIDDYFYPYPKNAGSAPAFRDSTTYRASGTKLSLADWRRQNTARLVRDLCSVTHSTRPGAKFGVSPFGIYKDNTPPGVRAGLKQYDQLYADPVLWLREGWVDYLVPQLYWRDASDQSFSALWRWWRSPSVNPRGIPIYAGVALDRLVSHGWPLAEIDRQLRIVSGSGGPPKGVVFWNIRPLQQNTKSVASLVRRGSGG